jgi:CRP-like cAMP-binding protein
MLSQAQSAEDLSFFRPHQFLLHESAPPDSLFQIQEGWASRYRLFNDGRRQITALYLPGDLCDPAWLLGCHLRQPVAALTNIRAVRLPLRAFPPDHFAQHRASLSDVIQRQTNWLVSLGRRTALERLAHLLLELFERMKSAGLAYGQQCALPLTQTDIADMTGLTAVHVNRTLQVMRSASLVELQSKWLRIPDLAALREAAGLVPGDVVS